MSGTGYLGAGDFWVSPATMHQGAFHASSADLGVVAAATYACVWAKPWHRALSLGAGLWALYAGGAPGAQGSNLRRRLRRGLASQASLQVAAPVVVHVKRLVHTLSTWQATRL